MGSKHIVDGIKSSMIKISKEWPKMVELFGTKQDVPIEDLIDALIKRIQTLENKVKELESRPTGYVRFD